MFTHDFPFDPTYGYDLAALMRVALPDPTYEPADLVPFWQATYAEAMQVAPEITLRPISSPDPGQQLLEIEFNAWAGAQRVRRIGGWLIQPVDEEPQLGIVMGHGYSGRESPLPLPNFGLPAMVIMPCLRGFNRSAAPDLPNLAAQHVVHGIAERDSYLHRGCVADVWAAATALLTLAPQLTGRLRYWGGSFGGGIGAMAVPWDARFSRAFLDIPSFGHHPIRLQLPCTGSGEAVRQYHAQHPGVIDVLRYYDAALCARYITVPTLVAAAKFDPAVPPPGQFAVYHALRCERELFVREYAHFELDVPLATNDPWPVAARWITADLAPRSSAPAA